MFKVFRFNCRATPGVLFYTHISDQYTPFYTKVIAPNARDATHVLDGPLYHEADLRIEEHYTDTASFTDHVFALCHLLGFRFAPRLHDLAHDLPRVISLEGRAKSRRSRLSPNFPIPSKLPNNAQTWLPKNCSPALDAIPKPYYCGTKKPHVSAVFITTTLFGLAPMRSTSASAAHHRESISACQPDVRCSKP
jgi:hypothetical protein